MISGVHLKADVQFRPIVIIHYMVTFIFTVSFTHGEIGIS